MLYRMFCCLSHKPTDIGQQATIKYKQQLLKELSFKQIIRTHVIKLVQTGRTFRRLLTHTARLIVRIEFTRLSTFAWEIVTGI